jgi:hypothetical protein
MHWKTTSFSLNSRRKSPADWVSNEHSQSFDTQLGNYNFHNTPLLIHFFANKSSSANKSLLPINIVHPPYDWFKTWLATSLEQRSRWRLLVKNRAFQSVSGCSNSQNFSNHSQIQFSHFFKLTFPFDKWKFPFQFPHCVMAPLVWV